jgi:AbiEi antitoxin C-terminal domain
VPATHFIDAMMKALDRRYYVSLVSAVELHSAIKPATSEPFQVMVDRQVTNRRSTCEWATTRSRRSPRIRSPPSRTAAMSSASTPTAAELLSAIESLLETPLALVL